MNTDNKITRLALAGKLKRATRLFRAGNRVNDLAVSRILAEVSNDLQRFENEDALRRREEAKSRGGKSTH